MVEPDPNSHVEQKQDGETTHRLEVAGEEGVGDCAETEEEQDSRRGPYCALIKDRDVDAVDFFAKVVRLLLGTGHPSSIPQGVFSEQRTPACPIR